ncbi:MAG: adenosylmethionine--8-amino-7-oxononanoate transaminase [Pseudomonadota bacterium]|nr:adenosylmethionine--8-amino-7-oxononanoate transaminase [Pseudomonadota bacterium]MDE3038480.1 adenosylmethionine--8-amino-7-oxononanoate transaminase [Pseudomonadota bacterium]
MTKDWYNEGLPHIWRPYCQMKTEPPPLPVVSTQGCRITLADGRELIDGIASWWSACHGYNHPHIAAAVKKQLEIMPHVMFGGLAHEPALTLARRLTEIAPAGLSRVFFADSGSVAVEVALKMALQYWRNLGKPHKDRFICFKDGYHGDTPGAMSVSDPEKSLHKAFKNSVIKQYVLDIPADEYSFAEFDTLLGGINGNVAGLIIEPLVQGAGGMRFHSADILAEIHRLAKKHNILFIADEIATGFYRTGNLFAVNEAGIAPDILCLGKALTGGTMTLGATLASEDVFSAFLGDNPDAAFMHGPTFMANPLACAAANASLDLFFPSPPGRRWRAAPDEDDARYDTPSPAPSGHPLPKREGKDWPSRLESIERQLAGQLAPCRTLPGVVDVRVKGAIGVVQMEANIDVTALKPKFIGRGVWVRPFRDIVYLAPPLVISTEELGMLTEAIHVILRDA